MTHRERINRRRVLALVNGGYSFGFSVYRVSREHRLDMKSIEGLVEAVRRQLKRHHRRAAWPR